MLSTFAGFYMGAGDLNSGPYIFGPNLLNFEINTLCVCLLDDVLMDDDS